MLGLGVTGCAQEAPGQGAVTLLHLEADHRCLVGGGVHVEDSGAAVGKLNKLQLVFEIFVSRFYL